MGPEDRADSMRVRRRDRAVICWAKDAPGFPIHLAPVSSTAAGDAGKAPVAQTPQWRQPFAKGIDFEGGETPCKTARGRNNPSGPTTCMSG